MEKTILLSGRIDSANAAEREELLNKEIGDFKGKLIIDAAGLEYISSAGLRVILRIKKANPDTKIINCTPETYDIFDMTGFTEMMDISKAYRELSVDGCEVIGEGANGIVYRTDPDTIVKVYKNPDSLEEIHNERELARKAFVMGIPTAIPYDVVKVGNLYGSVFELLNAKSFGKLINAGESVEELAKASVEILKTMHSTMLKDGELPSKRQEALVWAEYTADYLPEEIGKKLVELFRNIPETNNMLHGDFHIKNIMRQNGENLLIDMDTLSMGHPIFEFAAIFAAYIGFGCVDMSRSYEFLNITEQQCRDFWRYTVKYYFEGKDDAYLDDITAKASIICYTRLVRRTIKRFGVDDEANRALVEFCRNFLIENVPLTDKLYF
ncbi:MAG: phosphotransferase [Clostridia bacterium]|nr:phosphotransferase [Clostridia bacterium]MBR6701949.1 phosphotransferase [Clostridia bacterium]